MDKKEASNSSNKELQQKLKNAQQEDSQEIQRFLQELKNSKIHFKGFVTAIFKELSVHIEIDQLSEEEE